MINMAQKRYNTARWSGKRKAIQLRSKVGKSRGKAIHSDHPLCVLINQSGPNLVIQPHINF